MPRHRLIPFFAAGLLAISGCSSLLVSSTPPPVFYALEYEPPRVDCPGGFGKGIRGWRFSASSPYDRTAMIVSKPGGEILLSGTFQWVAPPGTLLSQRLLDDLSRSPIFTRVVPQNAPEPAPLELTGHIFSFACERGEGGARALLDVEVSVAESGGQRRDIFRRRYRVQSSLFEEDSSSAFAEGMSSAVRTLSGELSQDLCKSAESAEAATGK